MVQIRLLKVLLPESNGWNHFCAMEQATQLVETE